MDQNLGASITLSFALVVAFAIVLYQPEHAHHPSAPAEAPAPRPSKPEPPLPLAPMPPVTLAEPMSDASAPRQEREKEPAEPAPRPRLEERPSGPEPAVAAVRPTIALSRVAVRLPRRATADAVQAGFTRVEEGETLRDVSLRIYGSADGIEDLWRRNRDLLGRRDAPLASGMLLRTPRPPDASQRPLRK